MIENRTEGALVPVKSGRALSEGAVESLIVRGDLSKLTGEEKAVYYKNLCDSLGLNYLLRPFEYLVLNGKHVLYAKKEATEQLRMLHGVSVKVVSRDHDRDSMVYTVTVEARLPNGRVDAACGAVGTRTKTETTEEYEEGGKTKKRTRTTWGPATGDDLAKAMKVAETQAKRRVTLSICGLGTLDESEIASIPSAKAPPPIEPGQVQELEALFVGKDEVRRIQLRRFGVSDLDELNRDQADELVAFLKDAL